MSRDQAEKSEIWVDTEDRTYCTYGADELKPNQQIQPEMEYVGPGNTWDEKFAPVISDDQAKRGWLSKGPPAEGKV